MNLTKQKQQDHHNQSSPHNPEEVRPEDINRAARSISDGPVGLAYHRPQAWAQPHTCYGNVLEMMRREGGVGQSGWMFLIRMRAGVGYYIIATPHAVWRPPHDNILVDVTPHPDPKHAPVMQNGDVVFLVDNNANMVEVTDDVALSPPLRLFAVGDSPALVEYVAGKNEKYADEFEREKRNALEHAGR